jgi:hypothetical protein
MSNKRQSPRREVSKQARIVSDSFAVLSNCAIKDLSSGGARIEIEDSADVPDRFYLYLPHDRVLYDSEVRWRDGSFLGLRFQGPRIHVNNLSGGSLKG